MKKILLLVVVCGTMMVAQAQRVYFFYLQSDSRSPFYLKTGDKVYSASAHGYLIVPKLVDSTYNVVIGKAGFPEARFTLPVNGKDHGFLLRENGSQLSLFNLQTLALIEATPAAEGTVSYIQKTDRFTALLSQAADDTTLLQMAVFAKSEKTPPAKEETVKAVPEPVQADKPIVKANNEQLQKDTQALAVTLARQSAADTSTAAQATVETAKAAEQKQTDSAKTDTALAAAEAKAAEPPNEVKEAPVQQEVAAAPVEREFKRSVVVRRAESSTSEGFGLLFTDSADGAIDTIRLVIPNPKVTYATAAPETGPEDTALLQKETPEAAPETTAEKQKKEALPQKEAVAKEEGCKSNATGSDFSRLRRSMVARSSEDDMIAEAEKAFRNKCFTTEQLKTLSSLLLTSNGRYRFFEAAYAQVSDKENFRSLQNELWDRADLERFKTLLAQ